MMKQIYLFVGLVLMATVEGFVPLQTGTAAVPRTILRATEAESGDNEIVGRRITVKGAVNGGYYRSCVNNEVSWRL